MFVSQAKMSREVHSPIDMLTYSTKIETVTTAQSLRVTFLVNKREGISSPATLIFLNTLCWDSNMDTPRLYQTH